MYQIKSTNKQKRLLLALVSIFLLSACDSNGNTNGNGSSSQGSGSSSQTGGGSSKPSGGGSKDNEPVKVEVKGHTLTDTNPLRRPKANGQEVSEDIWDSYRFGTNKKLKETYNFTYRTVINYQESIEEFTKDGYHIKNAYSEQFFERNVGSTYYSYILKSDGYLRFSDSLADIENRYLTTLNSEIYTHMKDFSNYEYDDYDGTYWYRDFGFAYAARFQEGYLTYLYASISGFYYEIKSTFETSIKIPDSYYLK